MDKPTESRSLTDKVEQIFAEVAESTPEQHKNVIGDKWKFINPVVELFDQELKLLNQQWIEEIEKYYNVPLVATSNSIAIKLSHNNWQAIKSKMRETKTYCPVETEENDCR